MDVRLTIYSSEKEHFSNIVSLPCVIGRGKQCDVAIVHAMISRRHCEIYDEGGEVMVRDLGSLNGTFIGKNRIGKGVRLPYGDSFRVGKLHFKVDSAVAPRPEPDDDPVLGLADDQKPASEQSGSFPLPGAASEESEGPESEESYDDLALASSSEMEAKSFESSGSEVIDLDAFLRDEL